MLKVADYLTVINRYYPEGIFTVPNEVIREMLKLGFEIMYDKEEHKVKMIKYDNNALETSGELVDLAKKSAEALFAKYRNYYFVNIIRAINDDRIMDISFGNTNRFIDSVDAIGLVIKLNILLRHPARQNEDVSIQQRTAVHNFYVELNDALYDLAIKFEQEQGYSEYDGSKRIRNTEANFDPMKDTQKILNSKYEIRTSTMITKDKDEINKNTNIKIDSNKKSIKNILKQDNKFNLNELSKKKEPKIKFKEYRDIIFVYTFTEFCNRKDNDAKIEWHQLPDVVQDTVKTYYSVTADNTEYITTSIIGIDKATGKYMIRLNESYIPKSNKPAKNSKKFVPNNGKPANFYMAANMDIFNKNNILPSNCRPKYTDLPENVKSFIEQHVGFAIEIGIDKDQNYVIYIGKYIDNTEAIQLNGTLVTKDERGDAYESVDISDKNNIPFKVYEFKGFEGCTVINLYTSFETPSTIQYADIGEVGKGGEMRFMFDTAGDEAIDLTSCRNIILPIKYSKIKSILGKIGAF